eukprot:3949616-Prymnesium_polylepis.1
MMRTHTFRISRVGATWSTLGECQRTRTRSTWSSNIRVQELQVLVYSGKSPAGETHPFPAR